MGAAAKIILVTAFIAFANEWYQTDKPNFRIPVAGVLMAWVFEGIENLNENAGVGVAYMVFISSLLVPVKGEKSPIETATKIVSPTKGKK
jgi:hypothetical protein